MRWVPVTWGANALGPSTGHGRLGVSPSAVHFELAGQAFSIPRARLRIAVGEYGPPSCGMLGPALHLGDGARTITVAAALVPARLHAPHGAAPVQRADYLLSAEPFLALVGALGIPFERHTDARAQLRLDSGATWTFTSVAGLVVPATFGITAELLRDEEARAALAGVAGFAAAPLAWLLPAFATLVVGLVVIVLWHRLKRKEGVLVADAHSVRFVASSGVVRAQCARGELRIERLEQGTRYARFAVLGLTFPNGVSLRARCDAARWRDRYSPSFGVLSIVDAQEFIALAHVLGHADGLAWQGDP